MIKHIQRAYKPPNQTLTALCGLVFDQSHEHPQGIEEAFREISETPEFKNLRDELYPPPETALEPPKSLSDLSEPHKTTLTFLKAYEAFTGSLETPPAFTQHTSTEAFLDSLCDHNKTRPQRTLLVSVLYIEMCVYASLGYRKHFPETPWKDLETFWLKSLVYPLRWVCSIHPPSRLIVQEAGLNPTAIPQEELDAPSVWAELVQLIEADHPSIQHLKGGSL